MVALSLPLETDGKFGSISSDGAALFREVFAPAENLEGPRKGGLKVAVSPPVSRLRLAGQQIAVEKSNRKQSKPETLNLKLATGMYALCCVPKERPNAERQWSGSTCKYTALTLQTSPKVAR